MPRFLSRILKRKTPVIAAAAVLLLGLAILSRTDLLSTESQRFDQFTENVFRSELSGNTVNLHYTVATPASYGLDGLDVTLGDPSLDSRRQSRIAVENDLSLLRQFTYENLTEKQQDTYDVFESWLNTELLAGDLILYDEPLGPTLGIQAQLPVLLAEYPFRTKKDIEDYLTLLTQLPDYYQSILSFENTKSSEGLFMSDDCALEVISQCQDFISDPENNYLLELFNDKIDAITNLSVDEKTAYKNRNYQILLAYVIPAYEKLITGLTTMLGTGTNSMGLSYYPDGTAYYEYLVKSKVGDDRSVEKIEDLIKQQMVADYAAISELLQTESGLTTETVDTIASAASDPEAILEELRQKITQDFPQLPDVNYEVKYVHESLQDYLSPAFYLTPPIDDVENNVIYINPASDYNGLELFTTLAHEGYPGHLYQSVYFNSSSPDLLRSLLGTNGYIEGWATYVEMYAYGLWDEDPQLASLGQHNRSFMLGLASLLDIGIHYHGYTREEVSSFLEKLGFDTASADSLYNTILEAPANYLQYYVGYLNFCELRDYTKELMGDRFTLKQYHTLILEAGPAPFSILRTYLEEHCNR
jgi:uncharacterized protein (DUF885 family)